MHTKVFSIVALCTLLLLAAGCNTDKAKESQNAASSQPAATSTPDTTTPPPVAQSSAPPAAAPKPKASYKEAPPSESATTATAPVAPPTPTPTPPPPPVVIPAGTTINVRTTGPITSSSSEAKQQFEASLAKPIMSGGVIVVPKGAAVKGEIPEAKSAGRIKGAGGVLMILTSLTVQGQPYRISTAPVTQEVKGRGKRSAVMIGGGTGAGALIGGLAGGGKGAAIGALAGAGAGTAGATMTGKRDVVIPAETFLGFTLSRPLVLPPLQGGQAGQADQGSPGLQNRSPDAQSQPSPQDAPSPQSSQSPAQPAQGSQPPQQRPPN